MKWTGKVWRFGDHIDTDLIIPARFLNTSDEKELAQSCFADLRPEFVKQARPGDVIVAGENFGCGSSREHAPLALKVAGVRAIIAKSFARIFYRNAFNIGLPVLECIEAAESLAEGSQVSIDLDTGQIVDLESGKLFKADAIPEFMKRLIEAGGLLAYVKGVEKL